MSVSMFPSQRPPAPMARPILSEAAIVALETSFAVVAPRAAELVSRFYGRLFSEYPETRAMFPATMADQESKLLDALALVVASARKLDTIEPALAKLGKRHAAFGATPEHYTIVGGLLLETMADIAGSAWTGEIESSWKTAYGWVAGTMNGTGGEAKNMGEQIGIRNGHSEMPRSRGGADEEALKKRIAELEGQSAAINKVQAVIEFDVSGNVLTANQNFLSVLGYTLDEIKGRHHRMFVDPVFAGSAEYARFWAELAQGRFQAAEYKRIAKGGKEVWIQASYNPIFDAEGRITKVMKFATDITDAKSKAEEQKLFAQMVDAAPINIMYCDTNLTIQYMNETSRATLGRLEQYLPVKIDRMVGSSIDIFHKNPSHQRRMLGDPKNLPHRANIALGPENLSLLVTARYDASGRYVGPMLTWELITEKLALEKAAKEMAEREKAASEELAHKVGSLLEVVDAAARGDLTRVVTVQGEDAVGRLGGGLSKFFATMRTSVSAIALNATSLGAASEELSAVSKQMTSQRRGDVDAGERRLGGDRAGATQRPDRRHRHRGDGREHPRDRQERHRGRARRDVRGEGGRDDERDGRQARREQRRDRQGDQGHHLDRPADEPAGAQRDDRGRARRRGRQGLRGRRQRGQGARQGDRQGDRGHQPEDRGHPGRHTRAVSAIGQIGQIITRSTTFQNTIASAVEEQTATTNEIVAQRQRGGRGSGEIAQNITGVARAAQGTSAGAGDTDRAAGELSRMAAEMQRLVGQFTT